MEVAQMHNSQTNPESVQEIPVPRPMTLEEFLERDLEGYEYIKGELVPIAAAAIVHGEIGSNVHFLLASHVREDSSQPSAVSSQQDSSQQSAVSSQQRGFR